jgi:hypothetical protein
MKTSVRVCFVLCQRFSFFTILSTTGTFSSVDGASTCEECEAGKFSTESSNSACTDCSAGTFSATTASTTCTQCAPGKYSASTAAGDASTCTDCGAVYMDVKSHLSLSLSFFRARSLSREYYVLIRAQ